MTLWLSILAALFVAWSLVGLALATWLVHSLKNAARPKRRQHKQEAQP